MENRTSPFSTRSPTLTFSSWAWPGTGGTTLATSSSLNCTLPEAIRYDGIGSSLSVSILMPDIIFGSSLTVLFTFSGGFGGWELVALVEAEQPNAKSVAAIPSAGRNHDRSITSVTPEDARWLVQYAQG